MRLQDRVAIVTGGASGIGRAIVEQLDAEGAAVTVADLDADGSKRVASGLRDGHAVAADVTVEADVARIVSETVARFGKVDILVNNAGAFPEVAWDDLELAEWRRIVAINLDSVFLCCKAAYRHMRDAGYGRIVNIGSDTVLAGTPNVAHYVAAKGGVFAFTRALATELGPYGITVNTVAPGLVASEGVLGSSHAAHLDRSRERQAIARTGAPADIAPAVVFLASEEAAWITGSMLVVNGGKERW